MMNDTSTHRSGKRAIRRISGSAIREQRRESEKSTGWRIWVEVRKVGRKQGKSKF